MESRSKQSHEATQRAAFWPRLRTVFFPWRSAVKLALAVGFLAQDVGCSRSFYRKQADKEVGEVLADKDKYQDWKIENWHVYPDPREQPTS